MLITSTETFAYCVIHSQLKCKRMCLGFYTSQYQFVFLYLGRRSDKKRTIIGNFNVKCNSEFQANSSLDNHNMNYYKLVLSVVGNVNNYKGLPHFYFLGMELRKKLPLIDFAFLPNSELTHCFVSQ